MTESVKAAKDLPCNKDTSKALKSKKKESARTLDNTTERRNINASAEVELLLSGLVTTVGAVLTSRPTHVWQVYGGFQRIYEAVHHIFCHGCKHSDIQGNADLWPFVVGLRVLSPALGPCVKMTTAPQPADDWIRVSLEKLQLAAKVAALTSDRDHVQKHYHPWALMNSHEHVSAVITCLRALEENSQALLADINPELLVGTYQPPPGTTVSVKTKPSSTRGSKTRPQLWGVGTSSLSGEDRYFKVTASLPTSPVTDKEWSTIWPYPVSQRGNLKEGFLRGALVPFRPTSPEISESLRSKKKYDIEKIKSQSESLLKQEKEGASFKVDNKGLTEIKPSSADDVEAQDVSLIPRESPDGSSDNSDWTATSPVNHPSMFLTKPSQLSSNSSSTISKLVHGKSIHKIASQTGARPKELLTPAKVADQHADVKQNVDLIDNGSELGSSISPSLIQVDYGGVYTTSDGDSSSANSIHRPHWSQGLRPSQYRHRASSGRLASVPADSDQDSEDTGDGTPSQTSRRRKRPPPHQQIAGLSVKLLVDSRGVLESEDNPQNSTSKKPERNISIQSDYCGNVNASDQLSGKSYSSLHNISSSIVPRVSDLPHSNESHATSVASVTHKSIPPHAISTPVSANHHTDVVDGVAFSAPERIIKPKLLPNEATKVQKKTHGRSRSDGSQELMGKLRLSQSNIVSELEAKISSTKLETAKVDSEAGVPIQVRKRFLEDGGHSITPAADNGFFPRPQPGQSLIGFLSSKEFQKQYAELDRENAHFNISEAVIAALTQMQFDTWQQKISSSPGTADESDEEIRSLQARIREKRQQKLSGSLTSASNSTNTVIESTSDPQSWACNSSLKIESTTDYSVCESPQSSTYNSESDLMSELEEEAENDGSSSCEDTPILLSGRTSESEQSFFKSDFTSAENVAINLLKHFNEQRLPKASELEWLVSEQDVPQKLLPLPTSVAVSPDDAGLAKETQSPTQLRGTAEWAPPRPQLILTLHSNTKRSLLMGTQGWRCAGCGMRVSERLSRHFRLCNYLGRYFCTTCHSNQMAMIPAKVLHKWDFRLYHVANFSSELIKSMKSDPLLNVGALNPKLYKQCRHLHQTYIYRVQLYHTLPYINTCSRAQNEKMMLDKVPPHWAADPHAYSLDDLVAIKNGQLINELKNITSLCIIHVARCQVCVGRGFICEVCGQGEPIFPFQLDSTALCSVCSACFHAGCFSPLRCPRCIRRETRRLSQDLLQKPDT